MNTKLQLTTVSVNSQMRKNERKKEMILLEFPLAIVQRTNIARLEPPRDAVEVKGVLEQ